MVREPSLTSIVKVFIQQKAHHVLYHYDYVTLEWLNFVTTCLIKSNILTYGYHFFLNKPILRCEKLRKCIHVRPRLMMNLSPIE